MVFASFPCLPVSAPTVAPAGGLLNIAALPTSPPLRFRMWSSHFCLLHCRIDFCSSAFASAATSDLLPLPFSRPSALLFSLISPFHHHFDQVPNLLVFALASKTLLSGARYHSASRSTPSPLHSSPSWALPLSSSFESFSAGSSSFYDMVARFRPLSCMWAASSCL